MADKVAFIYYQSSVDILQETTLVRVQLGQTSIQLSSSLM